MDTKKFNELHNNRFVNDPKFLLAVAFWCEYYVSCERFDRTRCSIIKPDGTAIPATSFEFQAINSNASQERKNLMKRMEEWGIDSAMIQNSKMVACRLDYKRQVSEVKMIKDYLLLM